MTSTLHVWIIAVLLCWWWWLSFSCVLKCVWRRQFTSFNDFWSIFLKFSLFFLVIMHLSSVESISWIIWTNYSVTFRQTTFLFPGGNKLVQVVKKLMGGTPLRFGAFLHRKSNFFHFRQWIWWSSECQKWRESNKLDLYEHNEFYTEQT